MKVPNGEHAIVDIAKLRARVFASVGILESDAEELRTALLQATNAEARLGMLN